MPRKMSGSEIRTMDWLMNTIKVPRSGCQRDPPVPGLHRSGTAATGADPLPFVSVVTLTTRSLTLRQSHESSPAERARTRRDVCPPAAGRDMRHDGIDEILARDTLRDGARRCGTYKDQLIGAGSTMQSSTAGARSTSTS